MKSLKLCLLAPVFASVCLAQTLPALSVYAGIPLDTDFSGDGGPATNAALASPWNVAVDSKGNVYIADECNNRVRKVDTTGVITTIAGSGNSGGSCGNATGYSGDGGPATSAQLNRPTYVTVDSAGNVYISDSGNLVIRKVNTSGVISTYAGGGSAYPGNGGPATSARFFTLGGLAVDPSGNLYIADGGSMVRKVSTTGTITTVAGTTISGFSGDGAAAQVQLNSPNDVALDTSGNIYIADTANCLIRKVSGGTMTTVAGTVTQCGLYFTSSGDGGPATSAQLNEPWGVAVDSSGNIYIGSPDAYNVREVFASSGNIQTILGPGENFSDNGAPGGFTIRKPGTYGVAVSGGTLYVSDQFDQVIWSLMVGGSSTGPPPASSNYYFSDLAFAGGYQTTLTYINYGQSAVTCTTSFYGDNGQPLSVPFADTSGTTRTDVLLPGGSIHDQTDANLTAAVSEGWAEASCSGPVEASLLYRLYSGAGVALGEASVNAETAPTTKFVTFAQAASASTGIAYANPSTTQTETVTIAAYNASGGAVGSSKTVTLAPLAHGSSNVNGISASFTGSVVVTSNVPIVSLSLNAEAFPVFSSLPPGDVPATQPTGTQTYYFSDLAFAGGYQTTLTYINYGASAVTCTTKFYGDQGAPLAIPFTQGTINTRTDTLPPGASTHDQTTANLSATVTEGWAVATCSGPVQASLLYRLYNSSGTAEGEASVNAETAPTTEFATFAQAAAASTGIAYANPSTTQSASITIALYSSSGANLGTNIVTLGPMQHGSSNVNGINGSFTGFAKITSTIPIVSLSLNAEAFPVFSSLPPGDLPASTVLVP